MKINAKLIEGENMKTNVTFQLEKEDIEKLKLLAKRENRSVASYLRNIVLNLIAQDEKTNRYK